jgi:cell wall-associated NlpC family hydrolase
MADTSTAQAVTGQGIAAKAIEVGTTMAGVAYSWNGKTTAGFDCSGFVSYVLTQLFPNAPFSGDAASYIASDRFVNVTEAERRAGDIVIFPASGGAVNHIGIVLDDTRWIGSQSSTGVKAVLFSNPYWSNRPRKIRRLASLSAAAVQLGLATRARALA